MTLRILYITPSIPGPIRARSFNLLPRLARHHSIDLISLAESEAQEADGRKLWEPCCRKLHFVRSGKATGFLRALLALPTATPLRIAYCKSAKATDVVRQAIAEGIPDVIYVERWRALQWVPPACNVPVICDPVDSMILRNSRLMNVARWWERLVSFEEYVKFLRFEPQLARRADSVVFCSRVDLECLQRHAPDVPLSVVPNGVDCQNFFMKSEQEEQAQSVVFTGSYDYAPNRHAVDFFLNEIWPSVRREIPEAKFSVVGNQASRYFAEHAGRDGGLQVLDYVEDIRQHIARAAVAVAPIRAGSGISHKLLQAFATGTAVVSSSIPCGDLPVIDGQHLLLANDASTFSKQLILLLRNSELRRRLAMNARMLVETHYDWEITYRILEQLMLNVTREFRDQKEKGSAGAE